LLVQTIRERADFYDTFFCVMSAIILMPLMIFGKQKDYMMPLGVM